jgi:hypothetical protein
MDTIRIERKMLENFCFIFKLFEYDGIYCFYGEVTQNGTQIENFRTPGITDDRQTADKIFDILVENTVSPTHFCYVIDEIIV